MRQLIKSISLLMVILTYQVEYAEGVNIEAGTYVNEHEVLNMGATADSQSEDDGEEKETWEKVVDTFDVSESAKEYIRFSADVVGGNFHTCHLEGTAYRQDGYYIFIEKEISKGKCTLKIYKKKDGIVLEDPNHECKMWFCGARAGFDVVIFRKAK